MLSAAKCRPMDLCFYKYNMIDSVRLYHAVIMLLRRINRTVHTPGVLPFT